MKQIVTVGVGSKNTVTLSSLSEEGCMLSLQRDILTLSGRTLERQEISLPPLKEPETGLAAAAAFLLADCPPERLYDAMNSLA